MSKDSKVTVEDGVVIKEKTAEELSREWATKEMKLPRMVFWYINIYEFCLPIFILIGMGYALHFLFEFFGVAFIYRILLAGVYLPLFYATYVWVMTILCHWLNIYLEKVSPPHEGIYSREFKGNNVANPEVHYYHLRGFMYKWPVFMAKKSMFPWMQNYVLRKVGGNKIHRDALYGECFVGLEFTDIEEGAVMMEGSSYSSHVVDSIFGSLSVLTIHIGKNATIHANVIVGPGAKIEAQRSIAPKCLLPKRWKERRPAQFQWGNPVPMGKGEGSSFIDLLPERLKYQWEEKKVEFNLA